MNKVLNQLGMSSTNQSAAVSLDVELRRGQNYNAADLLSYIQANIPNLKLEKKVFYDHIMQTITNGVLFIF